MLPIPYALRWHHFSFDSLPYLDNSCFFWHPVSCDYSMVMDAFCPYHYLSLQYLHKAVLNLKVAIWFFFKSIPYLQISTNFIIVYRNNVAINPSFMHSCSNPWVLCIHVCRNSATL